MFKSFLIAIAICAGFSQAKADADVVILQKYHFVFVRGYLHEFVPGYFQPNLIRLQQLGLAASVLAPSSYWDVSAGSDWMVEQLEAISNRVKKPLIIVGHSLGGTRALAALVAKPELAANIAQVIAVQSPVNSMKESFQRLSRKQKRLISERTLYVTSAVDNIVSHEDMTVPGVGRVLVNIDTGHLNLVTPGNFYAGYEAIAFTDILLRHLSAPSCLRLLL